MKAPTRLFASRVGGCSQSGPEQPLVQLPPRSRPTIEVKPAARDYSDSTSLMLIVGLSFLALVYFLIRGLYRPKNIQPPLKETHLRHRVSCAKCRFFNHSPYLKCAVHPQKVNKIDAKDCPDFWPDNQDQFHTK
jgi:hypothetical protein